MKKRIWKKMLIWLMAVSLVMPGMSGFAAEEIQEEPVQILEMEDIDIFPEMTEETENEISEETQEDLELQILEIEEMEEFEDLVEIPKDFSEEYAGELQEVVVTDEMKWVSEAGLASAASVSDFSMYTVSEYSGSYGAQLEGCAAELYAALVNAYVTQKGTGEISIKLKQGYKFSVTDLGYDENGTHLWEKNEEEYSAGMEEMSYDIQSAYDAFMYDYPEVFWFAAFSYVPVTVLYKNSSTGEYLYGALKGVNITPKERYSGASGEISAFELAVDSAAAQIAYILPEDAQPTDIIEEIHDYLCFKVVYQENSYAHTAAGVFLKGGAVVCEGYAKAFKILCAKFGLESVLIPGGALKSDGKTEGHMWNYVNIDGRWYMIDATWDDQDDYISKVYFLAGSSSQGFNKVISEERTPYTRFSGNKVNSQSFVLPVLGEQAYTGTWHEWYTAKTVDEEATCTSVGNKSNHCRKCGEIKGNSVEEIPVKEHSWDEGTVAAEPTCAVPGQMLYVCAVCGLDDIDEIEVVPHSFGEGMVDVPPTCSIAGAMKYECLACGADEYDEIPVIEHTWENEFTLDKQPSCAEEGEKSIHCTECEAKKDVTSIEKLDHEYGDWVITENPGCVTEGSRCKTCSCGDVVTEPIASVGYHSWDAGKITIEPTCIGIGQLTYTCEVCKTEEYDEVPVTEHIWDAEYTIDRNPTCTTYGQESIHCSYCDAIKPGSSRETDRLEASFTADALTLQIGQKTNKLKVSGLVDGDYIKSWKSGNKKIVRVNQKGKITAKNKIGKTEVIITLANDTYGTTRKYRIPVTVRKMEIKTLQITGVEKTLTIKKGEKYALQPVLVPITSQQGLTYSSSKPNVAAVSAKGVITAKAAGKAKITICSGKKKLTVTVTIPKTETQKIKARQKVSVKAGKSVVLKVQLMPANSDQKLRFVSKNKKIASVDQNGKITGKKKGKAKIVVKSGSITHICTVTVK